MDNIAYLNLISSKPKPQNKRQMPTFVRPIIIATIALTTLIVLISIIANISKSISARETDFVPRLIQRTENFEKIINEYGNKLESSALRAETSQLQNIVQDMKEKLPAYVDSSSKQDNKPIADEELEKYYLASAALENGRVGGRLDRTFANYATYYISTILSLSDFITKQSSNKDLIIFLETKSPDFSQKQQYFSNFSDVIK